MVETITSVALRVISVLVGPLFRSLCRRGLVDLASIAEYPVTEEQLELFGQAFIGRNAQPQRGEHEKSAKAPTRVFGRRPSP